MKNEDSRDEPVEVVITGVEIGFWELVGTRDMVGARMPKLLIPQEC